MNFLPSREDTNLFSARLAVALVAFLPGMWVCYWIAQTLVPQEVAIPPHLFLHQALKECHPKRIEQILYLCMVALPTMSFACTFILPNHLIPLKWWKKLLGGLAVFCFIWLIFEPSQIAQKFIAEIEPIDWLDGSAFVLVTGAFYLVPGSRVLKWIVGVEKFGGSKVFRHFVIGAVLTLMCVGLFACFFSEPSLPFADRSFAWHFTYTFSEFSSAVNGLTAQVDFFPQYQNILPLLAIPYFKVFGLSVTSFSVLMTALSCLTLGSIFYFFRLISGSWFGGATLMLILLPLAFFPDADKGVFSYFPIGPLRLVVPCLLMPIIWNASETGNRRLYWAALGLAGFGVLNNPDFGIATWLAVVVTFASLAGRGFFLCIASAMGVLILEGLVYATALLARSGSWPDFEHLWMYQKIFSYYGLMLSPVKLVGWHWLAFVIVMSNLFLGLDGLATKPKTERTYFAMQIYTAIFTLGASSYFAARSVPNVLCLLYILFGINFLMIALQSYRRIKATGKLPCFARLQIIAVLFLIFLNVPLVRSLLSETRSPVPYFSALPESQSQFVEKIRKLSPPSSNVEIFYPFGFELAERAGVRNRFPFSGEASLALYSQLDTVENNLKKFDVRQVYGNPPEELTAVLTRLDFKIVDQIEDFQIWTR